eukprot:FR742097.1.p1 GENE.FR742097.1~~FR742097.1.p1  ORF type:complete len:137 (+),score=21.43 FR742097.1:150-560(+)
MKAAVFLVSACVLTAFMACLHALPGFYYWSSMVILVEDYDGDGDIDAKDMKNHLKEFDVDGDADVDYIDALTIAKNKVSEVDFDGDSSSIGEMKVLQGMCLLCLLFLLSAMAVDIGPYAATTPAALKRQHAKRKLV